MCPFAEEGGDFVEVVDVDGEDAVLEYFFDEVFGGDFVAVVFGVADEVDFGDDDDVGGGEAAGEFVEEEACS